VRIGLRHATSLSGQRCDDSGDFGAFAAQSRRGYCTRRS
jgi:hypothetical protein